MKSSSRWIVFLIILILTAAILAPGCSQFKSSKRMDLTPFAENMIALAGDIQYGFAQQKVIYLRNYSDVPEVDDLNVYLNKMRGLMRGSIAYSIAVATLSNSRLSGSEQSIALANYLDGLLRPALEAPVPPLHISIAQFDTILENARGQDHLLSALGSTQPIINEIARLTSEIIDDANLAVDEATDAIQAALLRVKLGHIETANEGRRQAAVRYEEMLAELPGVLAPRVIPGHVFHQYTIRITGGQRDLVRERLDEAGIGTMVYYPIPIHRLPVYESEYRDLELPVTDQAADQVLSIPIWPEIECPTQERVVASLQDALAG